MTIGIVGLGLIGGSLAKTIKKKRGDAFRVLGFERNESVTRQALADGAIDEAGALAQMEENIDLLFLALYPTQTIQTVKEILPKLRPGCVILDLCGVKSCVCDALTPLCEQRGLVFVGGHPMAGREFSGYSYAQDNLFDGASMILTPSENTPSAILTELDAFFLSLGFGKTVVTSAGNHDRMIAFTSQLAHVVSNAFIKSPEADQHQGYSAGSYKDLTRVARMNEQMWTELFLCNQPALLRELDILLEHLGEYRQALANCDANALAALLKAGSDRKKTIDEME